MKSVESSVRVSKDYAPGEHAKAVRARLAKLLGDTPEPEPVEQKAA